ncbi:unnamed protein product [Rangifer tarandus platyrhynchus]|uniref:Uncharacterized protein n=1 Tax=Rangifer tarandus platyrhynchus TaxID=3082113 RepID=A0AC59YWQ6_RANTA
MQGRRRVPRGLPDSVLRAQESLNQEPLGFLLRLEPPNPSRRLVGFIISDLVQTGWLPAKWFCAALQGMTASSPAAVLALGDCLPPPPPTACLCACFVLHSAQTCVQSLSNDAWGGASGDLGDGLETAHQPVLPCIKLEELAGCVLIN